MVINIPEARREGSKKSTETIIAPKTETSFGGLARQLNDPTSSVGRLNRTKEWQEGFEASRRGKTRNRNPYGYPATAPEAVEWQDGWECKFFGEQP